MEDNNLG